MNASSAYRCRGIATLYMMLLFTAAAVIAAAMLERQELALSGTAHFIRHVEATEYAYGAESYARQIIYQQAQIRQKNTPPYPWGAVTPAFPVSGGTLSMRIDNIGGRFNVNSLLGDDEMPRNYFIALCETLQIDKNIAQVFVARLTQAIPVISSAATPSTPQAWMSDPSELIDFGLPPQAYAKIAPYLIAVPSVRYFIDINTAPGVLLRAYGATDSQISTIEALTASGKGISESMLTGIGTTSGAMRAQSDWFQVTATVTLGGEKEVRLRSLLLYAEATDNTKQIFTVARSWGD